MSPKIDTGIDYHLKKWPSVQANMCYFVWCSRSTGLPRHAGNLQSTQTYQSTRTTWDFPHDETVPNANSTLAKQSIAILYLEKVSIFVCGTNSQFKNVASSIATQDDMSDTTFKKLWKNYKILQSS